MVMNKETSNPNTKQSQNSSNVIVQWPSRVTTIFCEACVDEVFKGNRSNTHFSKKGWANILATFEKKTGKEYPRAKEEVPEAAKFREKSLEKVDLLDIMFKDIGATGDLAWAPTSGMLPDDLETPKEGLGDTSADSSSPNDDNDVHEDETPNLTQPPNPTQNKGKKRVLQSSIQSKGKKGGTTLQNSDFLVEPNSTICNVMERVCTLDDIEKGSELYLMAARIFQK
ncbi:hypothetical protein ACB092_10G099300 [Castanea dentata]